LQEGMKGIKDVELKIKIQPAGLKPRGHQGGRGDGGLQDRRAEILESSRRVSGKKISAKKTVKKRKKHHTRGGGRLTAAQKKGRRKLERGREGIKEFCRRKKVYS